ncbi:hypothetical protein K502DRAFT_347779 [Neoconidiobolus thromboides FSU 785]|nr:hypothetical protein K502DRAFT_347779 [Neoconidiobolus thromboides FSU 785]
MSTLLHPAFSTSSQLDNELPSFTLPLRPASTSNIGSKDYSNDLSLLRSFALQRSLQYSEKNSVELNSNNEDNDIIAPSPRKLFSPPIIFETNSENMMSYHDSYNEEPIEEDKEKEGASESNLINYEFNNEENLVLSELLSITRPDSVKKKYNQNHHSSNSNNSNQHNIFRAYSYTPDPTIGFEGWSSRQLAKELGSLRSGIFPRHYRDSNSKYSTLPSKRSGNNHQHRSIIEISKDFQAEF